MIEDADCPDEPSPTSAANNNGNEGAQGRIDAVVLRIARLIGRQMAREAFARLNAANDNPPPKDCAD